MIDATVPDLWHQTAPPSPPNRVRRAKAKRRILSPSVPLEAAYATRGSYIRALVAESQAAHDSERRALTMADKPTTDPHERLHQLELAQHHATRQELVILALTALCV